jgi:4-oxalomesaconate tautomerase
MFIPHRVHTAIGVLAAVSVATAAAIEGTPAAALTRPVADPDVPRDVVRLEHPTGWFDTVVEVAGAPDAVHIGRSAVVSTARLLLDGVVFPGPARTASKGLS